MRKIREKCPNEFLDKVKDNFLFYNETHSVKVYLPSPVFYKNDSEWYICQEFWEAYRETCEQVEIYGEEISGEINEYVVLLSNTKLEGPLLEQTEEEKGKKNMQNI